MSSSRLYNIYYLLMERRTCSDRCQTINEPLLLCSPQLLLGLQNWELVAYLQQAKLPQTTPVSSQGVDTESTELEREVKTSLTFSPLHTWPITAWRGCDCWTLHIVGEVVEKSTTGKLSGIMYKNLISYLLHGIMGALGSGDRLLCQLWVAPSFLVLIVL